MSVNNNVEGEIAARRGASDSGGKRKVSAKDDTLSRVNSRNATMIIVHAKKLPNSPVMRYA